MPLKQPFQTLSLSPAGTLLAVAYLNVIQLVDVASGKLLATSNAEDSHKTGSLVRQLVWYQGRKLVSCGEDKFLKEWKVDRDEQGNISLVLQEQRELPKRANALCITRDGETVVVADKFGDVYAFPLHGCSPVLPDPPKATISNESTSTPEAAEASTSSAAPLAGKVSGPTNGPSRGNKFTKVGIMKQPDASGPAWRHVPARISAVAPVLGHVSMITDMLLLEDGDHAKIVTADRDEHIRVGRWPRGWEIENFLLGHKKFVSALATHPDNPDLLLSAGGDDTLRIWSLSQAKCLSSQVPLSALKGTAEITVHIPAPSKRVKTQPQKRKTGKDETESQIAGAESTPADKTEGRKFKTKKLDLAVRKMLFIGYGKDRQDENALLVLSCAGSNTLLVYKASQLNPSTNTEGAFSPQVIKLDHPILDITGTRSKRYLWVSMDTSASTEEGVSAIQCFEASGDGQLVPTNQATLRTLQDECSAIVTDDIPFPDTMTLYPEISLLSKDPAELGGWRRDDEATETPVGTPGGGETEEPPTKKAKAGKESLTPAPQ